MANSNVIWPSSYATVFKDSLASKLLDRLSFESEQLAERPNYWVPKNDCLDNSSRASAPVEAIRRLYHQYMSSRLPANFAAAEWWIQVSSVTVVPQSVEPLTNGTLDKPIVAEGEMPTAMVGHCTAKKVYNKGKGLAFHFDKDEALFKEKRIMQHPMLSSVLYLSGSHEPHTPRQGPTVIVEQQFDNSLNWPVPDQPERSALIWPIRGSFAIFDGRLGHGVLDSFSSEVRITMLINWWSYEPEGVHRAPPLSEESDDELRPAKFRSSGLQTTSVLQERSEDSKQPIALPVITLAQTSDLDTILIDDLLASYNLSLTGESAIHAVAIEHLGFVLYPVDAGADHEGAHLNTAGAFAAKDHCDSESSEEQQAN